MLGYKIVYGHAFEHISIKKKFNQSSKHHENMLQVVDSFYPLHRQISEVLKSISGKIEAFGERTKKASEEIFKTNLNFKPLDKRKLN